MPSPATAPGRSNKGLRLLLLGILVLTLHTLAEDRQVADVDDEPLLLAQPVRERSDHLWVNGDDAVTIPADQVEVLVVADRVVRRGAVGEVRVSDQAELLEDLEGAVDRRDVDGARVLLHLDEDLVRGGVAQRLDGLEHQLPLGRQAVAEAVQPGGELVGHRPYWRSSWAHRCGWSSCPT